MTTLTVSTIHNQFTISVLNLACTISCAEKAIDIRDLYVLMPGLAFCLELDNDRIVPAEFIEQMESHKLPIFQRIVKYLKVIMDNLDEMQKE